MTHNNFYRATFNGFIEADYCTEREYRVDLNMIKRIKRVREKKRNQELEEDFVDLSNRP